MWLVSCETHLFGQWEGHTACWRLVLEPRARWDAVLDPEARAAPRAPGSHMCLERR